MEIMNTVRQGCLLSLAKGLIVCGMLVGGAFGYWVTQSSMVDARVTSVGSLKGFIGFVRYAQFEYSFQGEEYRESHSSYFIFLPFEVGQELKVLVPEFNPAQAYIVHWWTIGIPLVGPFIFGGACIWAVKRSRLHSR